MKPERIARAIVMVVERGIWPEYSVPRWMSALQIFRVATPRLYRWGLARATRGTLRPTQA
jgi:hypothetical protein